MSEIPPNLSRDDTVQFLIREIERLTADNVAGQGIQDEHALRTEIERLRAAAVWHCEACGTVTRSGECDCTKMGVAEKQRLVPYDYRARLDAEIKRLQRMWADVCKDYGEARADNERMRALLHRWIVWNGEGREHDLADETRKALEGK